MKSIFFTLFILAMPYCSLFAQVTCLIKYSYDASGNRVKREYLCGVNLDPNPDPDYDIETNNNPSVQKMVKSFETNVQDFEISPNPSDGNFHIFFKGEEKTGSLRITNQAGQLILSKFISESDCGVNLTNFPEGLYYFTMDYNKEVITKKGLKIQ
jgi:Secretion system C-terminal sorting domain